MNKPEFTTISMLAHTEKSEVYLAKMEGIDAPVIVKYLRKANIAVYQQIMEIHSCHLPEIYSVYEENDAVVVIEQYIEGISLTDYFNEHPVTQAQLIEFEMQLCEAVKLLHDCNPAIIHRDIKPKNLIVNAENILVLIDFDASREFREDRNEDTRRLGTVEYAPPEQFGYSQTDVRSDIYAMGVVFYELVYGKRFVKDETTQKTNESPVISMHPGVEKRMIEMINKCTMFDPKNRFNSVDEMISCLEKIKSSVGKSKGMGRLITTVIGIAAVICLIIFLPKLNTDNEIPAELPADIYGAVQHYYKSYDKEQWIMCYNFVLEGKIPHRVLFRSYGNSYVHELDKTEYTMYDSVIRINESFLEEAEPGIYAVVADMDGDSASVTVQVHDKAEEYLKPDPFIFSSEFNYNPDENERYMAVVGNIADRKITGLTLNGEIIPDNEYIIMYDGKGLELTSDFFIKNCTNTDNIFHVIMDDGMSYSFQPTIVTKTKEFPLLGVMDYFYNKSKKQDLAISVIWNDYPELLYVVVNNEGDQIPKEYYETNETSVVVKHEYLDTLENGTYIWMLEFGDIGLGLSVTVGD